MYSVLKQFLRDQASLLLTGYYAVYYLLLIDGKLIFLPVVGFG